MNGLRRNDDAMKNYCRYPTKQLQTINYQPQTILYALGAV